MEDNLRKIIGEPTFGDKMTPILTEIQDAILERMENLPGDLPCYGDDAIRAAVSILLDCALDKAYRYYDRLGLTFEQKKERAKVMGEEIRLYVLKHCDFDIKLGR